MKTLLLVRHAKSSWEEPGTQDIDRPLNERGKQDAPEMAKRIKDKKIRYRSICIEPCEKSKTHSKIFY